MNYPVPAASPAIPVLRVILKLFRWSYDSDRDDTVIEDNEMRNQHRDAMECGGYNEAFIVQHWASYGPRY